MEKTLDPAIVLVYGSGMTLNSTTPPMESASADSSAVQSQFEAIIADIVWQHSISTHPVQMRLGELLAFPPGPKLLDELRRINASELAPDQRLIYAHLWERCVGWVNDQAAAAAAGFIDAVENPPEARMYTRSGVEIVDEITLDEVAITTGLSTNKAAMRIITGNALAVDGVLADTGAALRAGRISWEVATAFVDATLGLDDDVARAVQHRVLPRSVSVIDAETGAGCWRDRAWAVRELRRALIAVDPDTVAKRRAEATARRFVEIHFHHSTGTATLTAQLPAHQAMEVYDTLTALATRIRETHLTSNPDARPLGWDAARADALLAAIRAAADTLTATGQVPSHQGKARIEVGVLLDLPTLLGLADHPGEILGYGPIDPHYARLLAAHGDTWRRWTTDPVTGHLLDLGRTRYKPHQHLRDYILAAYPECSVPECHRHAPGLDIDHVIAWSDTGDTSAANLHAMCWADHQRKTLNHTRVRMNADGTITHTTRHGLTRTSEPYWRTMTDNLTHGRSPSGDDNTEHDDPPPF